MIEYEDTQDPRVGTTFEIDGWTVSVDAGTDDYQPKLPSLEADSYTPSQDIAYARGDWEFCFVLDKVSRDGVRLGSASIGGIESGRYTYTDADDTVTGQGYVGPYTEAVDDLITEAIADARATLARLCRAL